MEREENISLDQVVEMLQQGKIPPHIKVIDDTPLNGTNVFPQINEDISVNKKPKPWNNIQNTSSSFLNE